MIVISKYCYHCFGPTTIRNSKLDDIYYVSTIIRDEFTLSVHARKDRTHRLKRIVPFSERDKESKIACRSEVNNYLVEQLSQAACAIRSRGSLFKNHRRLCRQRTMQFVGAEDALT